MQYRLLFSSLCSLALTQAQTITNPILPGFHPDPSCIFVPEFNSTFFCVTSTFNWFPGLPIYASRDLLHWKHVSNALNRPEQLPSLAYINRGQSGIYAPTIRYHDGTFTVITTVANQALPRENLTRWDNIIFNTKDPYGEWDDPIHYYGPGIDPSPFWDDDGTAWVSSTFNSSGVVHAPVNLTTGEVTLPFKWLWIGTGGAAPEAAHIYKKDGWYYVLLAEGGTREKHMVTMARSRSLHGPFEGAPNNPLLTAFNNTESYFQAVGHVDLFQDGKGQWWAAGLTVRAGGNYAEDPHHANFPMGRETFLVPVEWPEGEFPIFTNVSGTIDVPGRLPQPSGSDTVPEEGFHDGQLVNANDEVDFPPNSTLPPHFLHWRIPHTKNYKVSPSGHPNTLSLRSSMLNLTGYDGDSSLGRGQTYVSRRQSHSLFTFSVEIDWSQLSRDSEEAGVAIMQDQSQHFDIGIKLLSSLEPKNQTSGTIWLIPPTEEVGYINETVRVVPDAEPKPYIRFGGIGITSFRRANQTAWVEEVTELPEEWLADKKLKFQIEAVNTTHYSFSAGPAGAEGDDLRIFGYTKGNLMVPIYSGTTVGAYATSNGRHGEGAFEAFISKWRYNGIQQVIEEPET
ncbi:beta-xylosidase [Corynespora cassiicola Philippines]|uniref:Beta-xylosidase n=1 Tax=Corynespora cassiicola Philippines TaxID=1448308 RepID=A0A2T2NIE9_CORCC|nr:beta-xylosidase [Corynespora cassiicola Philippines]